jgi:hypothetical protein
MGDVVGHGVDGPAEGIHHMLLGELGDDVQALQVAVAVVDLVEAGLVVVRAEEPGDDGRHFLPADRLTGGRRGPHGEAAPCLVGGRDRRPQPRAEVRVRLRDPEVAQDRIGDRDDSGDVRLADRLLDLGRLVHRATSFASGPGIP